MCQSCGAQHAKWMGKCPACGEWNTIIEEVIGAGEGDAFNWKPEGDVAVQPAKPRLLLSVDTSGLSRIPSGDPEFDRVLGGGIVPGSIALLGGEPGIGKSTLMLQVALLFTGRKVLFISGEESEHQIRLRAQRLGKIHEGCIVLTETNTQRIFRLLGPLKADLIIVDSVQTLHSDHFDATPGTVAQIRECAGEFQRYAKETGIPVILVGHVTKDGMIAGPKLLEHMVDTVLQFEGERSYQYRILRTLKNRFGSTAELGLYEMRDSGLIPVDNPSEVLISRRDRILPGMAIAVMVEGTRPLLIEVQALVSPAVYGSPQRTTTGFDMRRLHMLLAVLEKRCGYGFGNKDVFLNIAGGLRVEDPAIDLAVVSALISSFDDLTLPSDACFTGEVGLSGEIRPVSRMDERIKEAEKLGFKRIFMPRPVERKSGSTRVPPTGVLLDTVNELITKLGSSGT